MFTAGTTISNSAYDNNLVISTGKTAPIYLSGVEVKGTLIVNDEAPVFLSECSINTLRTSTAKVCNINTNYTNIKTFISEAPTNLSLDPASTVSVAQFKQYTKVTGTGSIERIVVDTTAGYSIDSGLTVSYPVIGFIIPNQPVMDWLTSISSTIPMPSMITSSFDPSAIDLNPPVPAFFPANVSINVPVDTNISVAFTETINILTADPLDQIFQVYDSTGSLVPCTVTRSNMP